MIGCLQLARVCGQVTICRSSAIQHLSLAYSPYHQADPQGSPLDSRAPILAYFGGVSGYAGSDPSNSRLAQLYNGSRLARVTSEGLSLGNLSGAPARALHSFEFNGKLLIIQRLLQCRHSSYGHIVNTSPVPLAQWVLDLGGSAKEEC